MAGPLDELTALLPPSARGNVTAPMPGPMQQPSPQLAMMPNLPTQATPMRQADPSGHTTHIPWAELLQTIAPVMGSLASGDSKGGFMQGYGHGQQMAQQEQEKRKTQQAQKTQQAEQFRMEIFQAAREITDPQEWAQFVNLATESAMHMGLISDPSEIKSYLTYPQHLNEARNQKELLDKLGEVMKRPDFNELMDRGATLTLKDGSRMKLSEAVTIAGALPEVNGKPVGMPKIDKTTAPSDYEQSFARYLKDQGKTPETATSADEFAFKKLQKDATADPGMADLNRTLKELQIATERDRLSKTKAAGLAPSVERQVINLGKGFDALPVVKNAQVAAEAVQFANSLKPDTTNPADDQGLIYAFAKAMDPNSVVREGEYATVQKYAQSWAQTYGFNAARMFSNVAFLTPQARANMKATIQAKFAASRGQYENIRRSYAQRINKITGQQDGETYLSDYAGAFPDTADQGGTNTNRVYYDANGNPKK